MSDQDPDIGYIFFDSLAALGREEQSPIEGDFDCCAARSYSLTICAQSSNDRAETDNLAMPNDELLTVGIFAASQLDSDAY